MTEQVHSDPVTLDDLKRAIASIPEQATCSVSAYWYSRAEAWRVAFEWQSEYVDRDLTINASIAYDEGMRLIREKLQS